MTTHTSQLDDGDNEFDVIHLGNSASVQEAQGRAAILAKGRPLPTCAACRLPVLDGEMVYHLVREQYPWLPEDHDDQDFTSVEWHTACDGGSMTAGEICAVRPEMAW